jgi:hypothetical protein
VYGTRVSTTVSVWPGPAAISAPSALPENPGVSAIAATAINAQIRATNLILTVNNLGRRELCSGFAKPAKALGAAATRGRHNAAAPSPSSAHTRSIRAHLACLRSDGLDSDAAETITSLAQFDILSNVIAISDAGKVGGSVYYPNFARFRLDRLLTDDAMRNEPSVPSDEGLATALAAIGAQARIEGIRYDGLMRWERTLVEAFIAEHL